MHPNITEAIQLRRSTRTYDNLPLHPQHHAHLLRDLPTLAPPFGAHARIHLHHHETIDAPRRRLGTYGWISGARDYLILIHRPGILAEEAAAFIFEQTILRCTRLGIATCWLGGSFSRRDFARQVTLQPGEKISIVSPVGYPAPRQRLIETTLISAEKNHTTRKPFGANFHLNRFNTPLTPDNAGPYRLPLEMVRLAPSANNTQSWRITLTPEAIHFYRTFSYGFARFDLGIALCHFYLTCRQLNLPGHFDTRPAPRESNATYVISFIPER
jgi:nitroreductase